MHTNEQTYPHVCATCAVRAACVHTFGAYWKDRSRGGIGCDQPTGDDQWAREVLDAKLRQDAHRALAEVKQVTRELDASLREDDGSAWKKFQVRHEGRDYETFAKSADHAVNCVRFKLYGVKPLAECPPFYARVAS